MEPNGSGGELLKLGVQVARTTIQNYINLARSPVPTKQTWATLLRKHTREIWAVGLLQTYGLFFRAIFLFAVRYSQACVSTAGLLAVRAIAATRASSQGPANSPAPAPLTTSSSRRGHTNGIIAPGLLGRDRVPA